MAVPLAQAAGVAATVPLVVKIANIAGVPFGPYQMVRLLGRGGMAEVWRAERRQPPNAGAAVAVKRILWTLRGQAGVLQMFLREARIALSLRHPNIVHTLEVGDVDGQPYIAMELIDGISLRTLFLGGAQPLPVGFSIHVAQKIARALAYAHAVPDAHGEPVRVIHRDVNPANIMVSESGAIKLLDFGLAKAPQWKGPPTEVGLVKGTLGYMAPELIRASLYDHRVDIFGLGVVLHELLTNRRLFRREEEFLTLSLNEACAVAPPSAENPQVSAELDRVVLRALAREPEARFADAAELEAALERVAAGHPWAGDDTRLLLRLRRGQPQLTLAAAPVTPAAAAARPAGRAPAALDLDDGPTQVKPPRPGAAEGGLDNRLKPLAPCPPAHVALHYVSTLLKHAAVGAEVDDRPTIVDAPRRLRPLAGLLVLVACAAGVLGAAAVHRHAPGRRAATASEPCASLEDTTSGETVASAVEVGSESELFLLAARAGQSLLGRLDGPGATPERALPAVLPAGDEAARWFAEGRSRLDVHDAVGARARLQQALALVPEHAPSHLGLAQAWALLGHDALAQAEAERARALAASLPREQRLWVEGATDLIARRPRPAIATFQTLLDFFPDTIGYGLLLAEAQLEAGQYEPGLATLERLRAAPAAPPNQLRLDLVRAELLGRLGRAAPAIAAAAAAEEEARARGAELLVAEALSLQARGHAVLGQCAAAVEEAQQAQQLFARAGNQRGVAHALGPIALCRLESQDHGESLRIADEGAALAQAIGHLPEQAEAQLRSASPLLRLGRAADAYARVERSRELFRALDDRKKLAQALARGAAILFAQGELAAARRGYAQALETGEHADCGADPADSADPADPVGAVLGLAAAQRAAGDLTAARRLVAQALATARRCQAEGALPAVLLEQAALARAGGHLDEAQRALETVRQRLAVGSGRRLELDESVLALAELALEADDKGSAETLVRAVLADGGPRDQALRSLAHERMAQSLLARGKVRAARAALGQALLGKAFRDFASRRRLALVQARVEAAEGHGAEAARRLDAVIGAAHRARFVELELEARLAQVELPGVLPDAATRNESRAALNDEASARGLLLIARKARECVAQ